MSSSVMPDTLRLSKLFLGVLAAALVACQGPSGGIPGWEPAYPEMAYPTDNPLDTARAALGERLFFDPILSLDTSVSCGSCHKPELYFADDQPVSPGVAGAMGNRNSPSLVNIGFQPYFMREGGVPTLEMQVLVPLQEEVEMHLNIVEAARRLNADSTYRQRFLRVMGDSATPYTLVRALANYERTLIDFNAPVDRAHRREVELSESAQRGAALFFGDAGCNQCHSGALFTDFSFANNGTAINPGDAGRARVTLDSADLYTFKVPSLRGVAQTAPYMHNGSLATLEEVLAQYNVGGTGHSYQDVRITPLGLSATQLADLRAFLEQL